MPHVLVAMTGMHVGVHLAAVLVLMAVESRVVVFWGLNRLRRANREEGEPDPHRAVPEQD